MDTIELTTTEFRQNQKHFLDLAAQGVSILICRGKELFMLNRVPVENRLDDETQKRIARAREEFRQGETTTVNTSQELKDFLESL
ncbi:MAG: hypothetical protein IJV05_01220 [Muribaculaceae bacterium]|nr:hypothetical protein [Muribaculaceae bacterium]